MSNVSFNQQVQTEKGRLAVELTSADLPAGNFSLFIKFTYSFDLLSYKTIDVPGASSLSISGTSNGVIGTVTITGSIAPSSPQFATLVFEGSGKGIFDLDITQFTIGGTAAIFADPASIAFDLPENPSVPDPDP